MNVLSLIGQIFKPAMEAIDAVHTSTDEKLARKAELLNIQIAFLAQGIQYEQQRLKEQAAIVAAEAKSEHWLTATWRPITMLTFVALLVATWLGWTKDIPLALQLELMSIVKIGLGGYVVGRSVEKVVPPLVESFKKREES